MERKQIIDLHCHLLPGLDDGIETMEDSVEACRIAQRDGITGIVATPHFKEGFFDATPDVVLESIALLQAELSKEGVHVEIFPGQEVHLTDNIPGKIREGSLLTINRTGRYLLLELPYQQYPVEFEKHLFAIKLAGITPILSHPERVKYFKDDINRVIQAVAQGALVQVTSSSLLGYFGEDVRKIVFEYAERGLVHSIGSDAHDTKSRPPALMEACREMAGVVGEEEAFKMVSENPLTILQGKELPERDAREPRADEGGERRDSFLRRFFRRP